jgi:hypothetical protein
LPYLGGSPKPVVYGGSSGMIEIVMDDDDDDDHHQQQQQQQQQQPQHQHYQHQQSQHQHIPPPPPPPPIPSATPVSEMTVPIISPPAPPGAAGARHNRGRSSADNSIGARISRATDRMRSASRTRAARDRDIGARPKSPEGGLVISVPYEGVAPYESIPPYEGGAAPYESVPPPPPPVPPVSMNYRVQTQVFNQVQAQMAQQQARDEYRTGLHRSEMI